MEKKNDTKWDKQKDTQLRRQKKKQASPFSWNIVLGCKNYEIFPKIRKKYLARLFERSAKISVCLLPIYSKKLWTSGPDLLAGDKTFVVITISA